MAFPFERSESSGNGYVKELVASHPVARGEQHFHDLCLVWAPEAEGWRALADHPCELGHRVLRILPHGARKPLGKRCLRALSAEGHAGGDHVDGLHGFCGDLLWHQAAVEPFCSVRVHPCGCAFYRPSRAENLIVMDGSIE